jgi:hypothetical protein
MAWMNYKKRVAVPKVATYLWPKQPRCRLPAGRANAHAPTPLALIVSVHTMCLWTCKCICAFVPEFWFNPKFEKNWKPATPSWNLGMRVFPVWAFVVATDSGEADFVSDSCPTITVKLWSGTAARECAWKAVCYVRTVPESCQGTTRRIDRMIGVTGRWMKESEKELSNLVNQKVPGKACWCIPTSFSAAGDLLSVLLNYYLFLLSVISICWLGVWSNVFIPAVSTWCCCLCGWHVRPNAICNQALPNTIELCCNPATRHKHQIQGIQHVALPLSLCQIWNKQNVPAAAPMRSAAKHCPRRCSSDATLANPYTARVFRDKPIKYASATSTTLAAICHKHYIVKNTELGARNTRLLYQMCNNNNLPTATPMWSATHALPNATDLGCKPDKPIWRTAEA